ncbi:MAG: chemotaxis protein CheD [Anaerovoracaceae bacterium]
MLKVGIADLKVARTEEGLITYALGSCIGICLYDAGTRIAGMVHIMLPQPGGKVDNRAKYATTGIPELIQQMVAAGASKTRLTAKIAGGAKMFAVNGTNTAIGEIGQRNAAMVRQVLKQNGIRILGEDCGLDYARTMSVFRADGSVHIKSYGRGEKTL